MLTPEQVEHFLTEGYVLVPGLTPREVAQRADRQAFMHNGMDPDDPSTWHGFPKETPWRMDYVRHPDLLAIYTPAHLRAGGQLACEQPVHALRCPAPRHALLISLAIEPGPWHVCGEHLEGLAVTELYPRRWQMFSLTYLHDVEPHGGGTVVYPGTHLQVDALARSEPQRYQYVGQLWQDQDRLDLPAPVELQPRAGDVLFLHSYLVHCKPMNCGTRPRFAVNTKWGRRGPKGRFEDLLSLRRMIRRFRA